MKQMPIEMLKGDNFVEMFSVMMQVNTANQLLRY